MVKSIGAIKPETIRGYNTHDEAVRQQTGLLTRINKIFLNAVIIGLTTAFFTTNPAYIPRAICAILGWVTTSVALGYNPAV